MAGAYANHLDECILGVPLKSACDLTSPIAARKTRPGSEGIDLPADYRVVDRTVRIEQQFAATWRMPRFNVGGSALILNLSAQGIALQLDREFPVHRGPTIIRVQAAEIPDLPLEARLRWFRRHARERFEPKKGFACGAIFVFREPDVEARWSAWFAEALARYGLDGPGPDSVGKITRTI